MSFSDKRQASKPPKSVFAYRGLETKHRNPSLHIHTKTNPHKVSNITQRYLQKCSYREGRRGVYSQRTPCLLLLISVLSSVLLECLLVGEMGRKMSGAVQGSLFCRVRAPEPFVTGHCQVGSTAGPAGMQPPYQS